MRSLELPGTPYFIQPLTVSWRTPLLSRSHSTAVGKRKNRFCPNTLVVRLGPLPLGLALGRWEAAPPKEELEARAIEEGIRADFNRYNAYNDEVAWWEYYNARVMIALDHGHIEDVDELDLQLQKFFLQDVRG